MTVASLDALVPAPRRSASETGRSDAGRPAAGGGSAAAPRWIEELVTAAAPARQEAAPAVTVRSAGRGLGDVLLTAAALLGVVVMGLTVFAAVTGLKPLVVRSGSMEPTIPTGALVLVRTVPASEIQVGDVVAVDRPDNTRVMHRVVSVAREGATAQLVLKGDANEDVDPVPLVVSEAGELVHSTPVVGRVSAFLASAKGGFVLGSTVTAALMVLVRRRS